MRSCMKTVAVLLFASFALAIAAPGQDKKECSKKKIHVKVASYDSTIEVLNSRYPFKTNQQWLQDFSAFAVKELGARAGNDIEIIPWEERIFNDDDPATPEPENDFIKPVPGNYEFRLRVIYWGADDQTGEQEFDASVSLFDRDLDGRNLENFSWHRPDVYTAIRSAIDRMSGRGYSHLLEEYEKTHFYSLRDPTMKLEVLDPGFVSPEPDEQKVKVEVETKDCREIFGEGTNLWFPSETDQGKAKPVKSSRDIRVGKTWWARTEKDGKMELEYQLMRGDDNRKIPIDIEIIGRGKKNIRQVVFIPVKTLKIAVEPEQKRVAPGDQTRVFVRLFKVDDKGTTEPVKGRTLTLKVKGLEDGKLEPKDKITTDENGVGTLTYTAGEKDKNVKIEASYKPQNYETTFKGEGEINSGAYSCTVELDLTSPFVADGRMTIAALGMRVVFDEVVFEEGSKVDPFGRSVDIDADEGQGTFTRFLLNDVWGEGEDRHRPTFIKGPPKTFTAQLTMALDVEALRQRALGQKQEPPKKPTPKPMNVKIVFLTHMGLMATQWGSHLGSSALGDFRLEFEAPWADLLAGTPVTLKVPYEDESDQDYQGTWTINFFPKSAKK